MRLVIVGPYPDRGDDPAGGVEVAVTRIAAALAARDVDVTVVAPGVPDAYDDGDVRVVIVHEGSRMNLATGLRRWRSGVKRVLRDLDTDVIHGHSLLACALAATDDSRPIPKLVTAHGNVLQDVLAHSNGVRTSVRRRLVKSLATTAVTRATAVVGVHPDWRLNVPVQVARFVHIPNIVDESFFRVERAAAAPRVLYCGGARHVKGWDILAAAWPLVAEAIPDATLEVLGWDGASGVDGFGSSSERIEVVGRADTGQISRAMARASVVALPSRFEIAPVTLAEAWAAGTPVVAAEVGGVASLGPGAALLVPPESPEALAQGLVEVLAGTTDVRPLVAEGRRRAEAFRADAVALAHLGLYEELLAS